jgi:choline dehydrogenase
VAQILFDGTAAKGVRLVDGTTVHAGAVVVCAGVYGTPSILLRSGIGPAADLRALGIPVLADLPGVGTNLVDHPATGVDCGYRGGAACDAVLHSIATFRSSKTSSAEPPDLMIWTGDPESDDELELGVVLLKPRSRGSVRLRSTNPSDPPVIRLPALEEAVDVERLAEGLELAFEIANDGALRRACGGPAPQPPGDLGEFIRGDAYSLPHVVGTCAMGPHAEAGAVVDRHGNVHGVGGVVVADASIMPDVPSGFTHLPTVMIAERLAEQVAERL